jgi:uncharacterized phage-associated protein
MPLIIPVTDNGFERLKQMILFISEEGESDPSLGAVKLNKLLYFAEIRCYLELKKPLTGARFQHLPEGPAPRGLVPARRQLIDEGSIEMESAWYLTQRQQRIKVKRSADLKGFSEDEIRIVREVMTELKDKNGKEVSDLAHDEWAYKVTEDGEDMPLGLAWLSSEPLTDEQIEFGRNLWLELNGRT